MNVLITGAGKGIGLQLVKMFTQLPNMHVMAVSRDISSVEKIIPAGEGSTLSCLSFDIVHSPVHELENRLHTLGSLDILINNAGYLVNKPFAMTTPEDFRAVYETNVIGTVKMVQLCLDALRKSSNAQIINTGSMGGIERTAKFSGLAAYSSSKAALANLSECLAEEFKNEGIRVNCLALGAVQTEMLGQAFPGYRADFEAEQMALFIRDFALHCSPLFNGKIIPVAATTP